MELRVVEIAHLKGLTMSDIARTIGISRVNLSNSLNGNPTLSRLREVAKILNVEVAELFKPSAKEHISGYIEYNNQIFKIDSVKDLKKFIKQIENKEE